MNKWSCKIILGLVISLGLFSCVTERKKEIGPFKDVLSFNKEKDKLTGSLIKKVYSDGKIESKYISSPDWDIELQSFIDADFNKMSNKDKYIRTETSGELSSWRDICWSSTDEKSAVKWAVYRYVDTICIGSYIRVQRNSAAYSFYENLTYLPNSGYSIETNQELSNFKGNSFNLTGEFENKPQPWRMFFDIGDLNIPVNLKLNKDEDNLVLTFEQGKEIFEVIAIKTDSGFLAEIPVFQSYMFFNKEGDEIKGVFHNLDKGPDYVIPFTANKLMSDQSFGYEQNQVEVDFTDKWETYFYDEGDSSIAIGLFDRFGDDLVGTFVTETGDYRFLQGKIVGDSFSLSTFDGSHLLLFTGIIKGDEIIDGHFYSGKHYQSTWRAKRNGEVELKDPASMTSIRQKEDKVRFSFPDLNGNLVSFSDERFKDKVTIIQIMGSWCPNCMDESRYYTELYNKYNSAGLEVVGLSFERSDEFEIAKKVLGKALLDLNIPYPVLIAGTPRESLKQLPWLTPIKSYPTSIFIDKNGNVVKIHTGFYGPGTGSLYTEFCTETEELINELLVD